jgi:signal transduction histidine kinase
MTANVEHPTAQGAPSESLRGPIIAILEFLDMLDEGSLLADVNTLRQRLVEVRRQGTALIRVAAAVEEERRARALAEAQQLRAVEDFRRARDHALALAEQLAERERQLQDLVGRLIQAQEEERRRVAYEIHDGVAQVAAATHQRLAAFAAAHSWPSARAQEDLRRAQELAQRTVREARRVIAGLRPTVLDDFGLDAALKHEVEALRADGWEIEYDSALGPERLPPALETILYRVAQEALVNVRKHAHTTRVGVTLRRDEPGVHLEVQDWGRGFDPAAVACAGRPSERVGIAGMMERVTLLGGTCHVRSRPGQGTRVVAEIPLPEAHSGQSTHDARK